MTGEGRPVAWLQSNNGVEIVSRHRLDSEALARGWSEQPLYTSISDRPTVTEGALADFIYERFTLRRGLTEDIARAVSKTFTVGWR